jgi:predicted GH43/DUF377 family glycosyl hydrolase
MNAKRTGIVIRPSHTRVVFRPFQPVQEGRVLRIIARIMALSEQEVDVLLEEVMSEFHSRHQRIRDFFLLRFDQVKQFLLTDQAVSTNRQLLIGSYFTQEYALESAALFNPSIVDHPDQTGLPEGCRRFVLSLRATGEGHISSITFRTGVIDEQNQIRVDEPSRYVTAPDAVPNAEYEKALFHRKLVELGLASRFVERVLNHIADHFTLEELEEALQLVQRQYRLDHREEKPTAEGVLALAKSNYEIKYRPDYLLGERIVFPSSPTERNGIEDARFVKFVEEDGMTRYYATYTAYDGKVVLPQLLDTTDFLHFRLNTLNGPEVQNKGFALFPRKVNGHYAMLSRQDNENIYLMFSDMIHFWYTKDLIMRPTFPWEYVQLGNCGSPIETEAGWLVLSHGVGPMRKYCIGAFLLDLHDPSRVIGRLDQPLLQPDINEREGYVPNVVYSCGALIHGRELVVPYAMSDYATSFATVGLDDLLGAVKKL